MTASGRILLRAPQTTGTVAYVHTGGVTCERQLTLTGATWPSWAVDASVRFDELVSDIQEVKNTTVVQLDAVMNPGQDVTGPETYTLYPRWYPLPNDFGSMVRVAEKAAWKFGEEISMAEMMVKNKYLDSSGDVNYFCVGPTQDQYGSLALYLHPYSNTTEPIDFLYRRRLRDLRYSGHDSAKDFAGTISVTADSAPVGLTVSGSSTAFESGMVGSILRISSSTSKPTGLEGDNPWVEQRVIASVTDSDTLTLDAVVSTTRVGVKYAISDPLDFDVVVYHAFLACAMKHLAIGISMKEKGDLVAAYRDALMQAKQADSRMVGRQVCHVGPTYMGRLADSTDREVVP
jgi:hypothetical protein